MWYLSSFLLTVRLDDSHESFEISRLIWTPKDSDKIWNGVCCKFLNKILVFIYILTLCVLSLCMLGNFPCFCCGLLIFFFKIYFLKKFFQEHYQCIKWIGSRSGQTFRRSWSGCKLFGKVISRQLKSHERVQIHDQWWILTLFFAIKSKTSKTAVPYIAKDIVICCWQYKHNIILSHSTNYRSKIWQ